MPDPDTLIGLDIGGTKCVVVRGDSAGRIHERHVMATQPWPAMRNRILDQLAAQAARSSVARVGIVCGGPLDCATGSILAPPNLPGWESVPIVEEVANATAAPVTLLNDADGGMLAEFHRGAARGSRCAAFLTCGTGLGAGLLIGGRLHRGCSGDAGEIGHWRLSDDGPVGHDKAGSAEGWASGGGIALQARHAGLDLTNAQAVAEAARAGQREAAAIMQRAGHALGRCIAALIDLLNPEVVVLGSLYHRCHDLLDGPMRAALTSEALPRPLARCRIVATALGEAIGDHAALAAALYHDEQEDP